MAKEPLSEVPANPYGLSANDLRNVKASLMNQVEVAESKDAIKAAAELVKVYEHIIRRYDAAGEPEQSKVVPDGKPCPLKELRVISA